jgi:IclR family acetate operon transcriptional repressor
VAVAAVKSLARALDVLAVFQRGERDLGVTEIGNRLGMPKAQLSKILATFREAGMLAQDPTTRRYSVGMSAFVIGAKFVSSHQLTREALPVLRKLVDDTGHSARLGILHGESMIYLLSIEGRLFLEGGWGTGSLLPPHATATGKVFLAFMPKPEAERLLDSTELKAYTEHTICSPGALLREVMKVRREGYARSLGEVVTGLGALGVPVYSGEGAVVAVLNLAFPVHLLVDAQIQRYVGILHEAARVLSARLGSRVYPFGKEQAPRTSRSQRVVPA